MKVFFSWSGERSHSLAQAFRGWLPNVIQSIVPWISSADITAGSRWQDEIAFQLKESRVGIIFLTPENVASPWLHYEVGALSRVLGMAYVCPYLFGFSPSELQGPFVQFQATTGDKKGTYSLIRTLNRALGQNSIDEKRLEFAFEKWWPDLEMHFKSIQQMPIKKVEEKRHKSEAEQTLEKALRESQPTKIEDLLQQVIRKLSGPEPSESPPPEKPKDKESVFIVHGHNEAVKEAVARFIEKLGPAVIILHEQPNEGRTIMEKFESHAVADYSVVLLTGDDAAAPKNTPKTEPIPLRARQNVIFELGFFAAKLGRNRISILYEEGVEIPSDFSGILYIPIDSEGAWRFKLAKELKTAGLKIDLNNAI